MSAEEEKGTSETPAEEPAAKKAPAAEKPAAKAKAEKKPAAKKAPAKKAAAAKEPVAAKAPAESKKESKKRLVRRKKDDAGKAPRRRVVRAHARYVRTSARKARMVCGHLRGKSVGEARAILAFTPREVARDWSKLLESAVANAESNHELLEDDLVVREAYADEGPTIKRFQPRAMGRATPIRKRTSHLTITLTPGPEPGKTKRQS
jgi:ribosomal protein L22